MANIVTIKVPTDPDVWGDTGEAGRSPALSRNCSNGEMLFEASFSVEARLPTFVYIVNAEPSRKGGGV